jgi:uncharacterized protein (DUF1697 family)
MKKYIALFRGINVGGNHLLPMRELVELLAGLGLQNIKTYIQSGNVIFETVEQDAAQLAQRISLAVRAHRGFAPEVLLLAAADLENVVDANPYPEAEPYPKTLHVYFLASEPPSPDLKKLESLKLDSERFTLKGKLFYLHAPDGIGRSKLATSVEKALGVPATGRNWQTVCQITALARSSGTA